MWKRDQGPLPRFPASPQIINNHSINVSFVFEAGGEKNTDSPQVQKVPAAAGIVEDARKLKTNHSSLLF